MRDEIFDSVQLLKPIASDLGITMSQMAIAWVLANPGVSAAIIGASKPAQVKENVKASGIKLTPDVMKAINEILKPVAEFDPKKNVSPNPRA